jgi:hypothetical protein
MTQNKMHTIQADQIETCSVTQLAPHIPRYYAISFIFIGKLLPYLRMLIWAFAHTNRPVLFVDIVSQSLVHAGSQPPLP